MKIRIFGGSRASWIVILFVVFHFFSNIFAYNPVDLNRLFSGETNMRGADLKDAPLSGFMASGPIDFSGTDFRGADLSGAQFLLGTKFCEARFGRSPETGDITSFAGSNFSNTNCFGAIFYGALVAECCFSGANLMKTSWFNAYCYQVCFAGAQFSSRKKGTNAANLSEIILIECDLSNACLRKVFMRGSILDIVLLDGANLRGADACSSSWVNVTYVDTD